MFLTRDLEREMGVCERELERSCKRYRERDFERETGRVRSLSRVIKTLAG